MIITKNKYKSQINKIVKLFERSFNKKINPEFLKWRYIDNPTGEFLGAVEYDGNEIIANYTASPVIMYNDNSEIKTALSMTTMTDPDYRGQGLFTKLAKELYKSMKNKNYDLIWGFPNKYSHRGFITKLNWNNLYEIPTMKLNLNKARVEYKNSKYRTDDNFNLKYDSRKFKNKTIYVKKDKKYLKWRYKNNPVNDYKNIVLKNNQNVEGYCVVKSYKESLDIVDYHVQNYEEGLILLKSVLSYAFENKFIKINSWVPLNSFTHNLFEKIGFVNDSPITYIGFKRFGNRKVSDNYKDWYVQMGDSDVY